MNYNDENEEISERWELACERLREWITGGEVKELPAVFNKYMLDQAMLLEQAIAIIRNPKTMANESVNKILYEDIAGDAYERSYTNPDVCKKEFGEYGDRVSDCLNWIAANIRDIITASYDGDTWTVLIWVELFLELTGALRDDDELGTALKEMIYYFVHDYDEIMMDRNIHDLVVYDKDSQILELVMERDHSDPSYLYEYGEYITDNEIKLSAYLSGMSDDDLDSMAKTYTEGYRKGFELAGIDLTQKKTVEIRYPIGMESMVKRAVLQFQAMGLSPVFRRKTNTKSMGVISTPPNRQYLHDHRFDDAIYLNHALAEERLKKAKASFDKYADEAGVYAGPAVIESFGEKLFAPDAKASALKYSTEQEKISIGYKRDYALLQDKYIPGEKRSFTIIAYPIPEIGDAFDDIFKETIHINNLDQDKYREIHQKIIDALDEGEYVWVRGCGDNRTDIKVMLHHLEDPAKQTNFENCLADVNIPVGEVFTSPVLTGTDGILYVSYVFLNGLKYEKLWLEFRDGMVTDYGCSNYADDAEGKRYIKENILNNHDTLPIGEFAIGTNTSAFVMGRKFGIEAYLPILIAEKTGPHFAVGDTCYSMSEENRVFNPDGKEIIAKENECSALRKEAPEKAYFQCHTDITIPYDELGSISVFTKDGKETIIIRNGRFVLPGTEELNIPLEQM